MLWPVELTLLALVAAHFAFMVVMMCNCAYMQRGRMPAAVALEGVASQACKDEVVKLLNEYQPKVRVCVWMWQPFLFA